MYTQFATTLGKVCLGFYTTSCVFVLVLVPFTVFWYEGLDSKHDDDEDGERRYIVFKFIIVQRNL